MTSLADPPSASPAAAEALRGPGRRSVRGPCAARAQSMPGTAPREKQGDPLTETAPPPDGAGAAGRRSGSAQPSPAALALPMALAGALYAAAALVYLRPIWATWSNHIAPDPGDPVFSLYLLKWVVHQIRSGFPNLWDANYF